MPFTNIPPFVYLLGLFVYLYIIGTLFLSIVHYDIIGTLFIFWMLEILD